MELQTRHFGTINVNENDIIFFPSGLPGFENVKKYILLGKQKADALFFWLQSVDEPGLAFVVTDPFCIRPDYYVNADDEDMDEIHAKDPERILTLAIATIPANVKDITVNLKAPVIINMESNMGKQIIMKDETFPVKYYIMNR